MYIWRQPVFILGVVLVIGFSFLGFSGVAVSEPIDDSKIILTSRFLLWDTNEKMIDSDFHIHMFYYNYTYNDTVSYDIRLNQLTYNGTFQYYKDIHIDLNNTERITNLKITFNNETVFDEYDIMVVNQITGSSIQKAISEWLISLNPAEWTAKEWNIFFGVIVASLISIPISLRFIKIYRKRKGVTVVE